jgi:hypothetical protein
VRVARELVEVKLARQATQQKKKEGPHRGPSLYFQTPGLNLDASLPQLLVGLSFSTCQQNRALLRCRLVRSVLVFPAAFLRVMAFVMML